MQPDPQLALQLELLLVQQEQLQVFGLVQRQVLFLDHYFLASEPF